jgi:hypothetical protein
MAAEEVSIKLDDENLNTTTDCACGRVRLMAHWAGLDCLHEWLGQVTKCLLSVCPVYVHQVRFFEGGFCRGRALALWRGGVL